MDANPPVYNYTPPSSVTTNQNQQSVADLVAQLRALGVAVSDPPKILTPEEAAREAIDRAGAGLGLQEQLSELYRHVDTIARKVGI